MTKGAIAAIAFPVTIFVAMAIIDSLNLFPGTAVNGVSNSITSIARCHMDKSELKIEIAGMRKLDTHSVRKIVSGQLNDFIVSEKDSHRMRFHQQGVFWGRQYGAFSRPYDEPASRPLYRVIGPDICLSVNKYIGVMSFYTNAEGHLFEVIYSARDRRIHSRRM